MSGPDLSLNLCSSSWCCCKMIGVSQKRTDTAYGNSLVARREFTRQQQKHRETIRKIRSSIGQSGPILYLTSSNLRYSASC